MFVYSLLFFLPAIPCMLPFLKQFKWIDREKCYRASMIIFFVVLFFLTAFRSIHVGADTTNYLVMFKRFSAWSFERNLMYKEPAFALLCKIVSLFTHNYQVLIVIVSIISIVPVAIVYTMEIEYPMTTIALLLSISNFYMFFSGMRQSIAISLGMIAFLFSRKKKLIPFLLIVVLAFLFHRTAMILIFMYPLYHMRIVKKSLVFIIPIMVLIFVFNKPIFDALQGIISDYEGVGNAETGSFTMLFLLIAFSVFSFIIPNDSELDSDTIGMRNFLLMATVVQMFVPLNIFVMRMGYYYMIFLPLVIPKVIRNTSIRWRQFAIAFHYIFLAFFTIRFFVSAPSMNALHIFPYTFFWEVLQ